MGEKDIVTNAFFQDNRRFADIVNMGIFHGKKILQAEKLKSAERYVGTVIKKTSETAEESARRTQERHAVGRFRDLIRKSMEGMNFAMIGIENQWNVHYAMPVRVMGYDFLTYDNQLKKIKKIHKREKDLSGADYVSGFSAEDKLHPVITLLIYYGEEPWDGPTSLSDMIDWSGIPKEVQEKTVDYPMYLVDVRRFEDTEKLETDTRIVFGFLQRQENRTELMSYIQENEKEFSELEEDAYDMISILADTKELTEIKEMKKQREGVTDMCKALEEMKQEARAEAIILDNLEEGKSRECILEKLIRKFGFTKEQAENYYEKYADEKNHVHVCSSCS